VVHASPGKTSVPTKVINETINKVIKPSKILFIIKKNIIKIIVLNFKNKY
jgi:hypothetical protein